MSDSENEARDDSTLTPSNTPDTVIAGSSSPQAAPVDHRLVWERLFLPGRLELEPYPRFGLASLPPTVRWSEPDVRRVARNVGEVREIALTRFPNQGFYHGNLTRRSSSEPYSVNRLENVIDVACTINARHRRRQTFHSMDPLARLALRVEDSTIEDHLKSRGPPPFAHEGEGDSSNTIYEAEDWHAAFGHGPESDDFVDSQRPISPMTFDSGSEEVDVQMLEDIDPDDDEMPPPDEPMIE